MADIAPSVDGASIVLVGSFAPGIFHPQWLAAHDLLPSGEADQAKELVVTNEFSRFQAEWLNVEAVTEKLVLATHLSAYFRPLRDLAESILNLLPETPVNAIGLNRSAHFPLANEAQWHRFGHRLAPKGQLWEDILKKPGTARLTVQGQRDDGYLGLINATIEPSAQLANGIYVDINDHFQSSQGVDFIAGADWASKILREEWQRHQERIAQIRQRLLQFAKAED